MNKEAQRISQINDDLYQLSKGLRILTQISWSSEIRETFFRGGCQRIPVVTYPQFDGQEIVSATTAISSKLGSSLVDDWLRDQAEVLKTSARMLESCGSKQFFEYSKSLYGSPENYLSDDSTTSMGLAKQFDEILGAYKGQDLGAPAPACYLAETVAERIRDAVDGAFGNDAPDVFVVDELSANALAGASRIRIRKTACFTDRDIIQLIQHEAFVHVATSLNGLRQEHLPMLGASHAGTTRTQEGLAVFAEFITGSMDLDRMRRLSDRVLGIQMAIDGADFIDVFRFFDERLENSEQAYENTRRVFRGGILTGGAPFTKDIVYLDGLLRVHNFLRTIVSHGRADVIPLLFCGKLDIEYVPVLSQLTEMGLCKAPRYLPEWVRDRRFLLSYLAYSSFLNSVEMTAVNKHYESMLEDIPVSSSESQE